MLGLGEEKGQKGLRGRSVGWKVGRAAGGEKERY